LLPLVAISSRLFKSIWPERNIWLILAGTLLWYGASYEILTFLIKISSYPFSLSWSESSAFYSASLFFSEKIFEIKADLPMILPTGHLLLSIPYLIDGLPIWAHRLWEVVLWIGLYGLAVVLITRRLELSDKLVRGTFLAWVFLFLFQGPVYYFLLISVIPILWGFDKKRFYRTLLLVLIGSVWAGMSRVNWVPVPGLLAATLYFLEQRTDDRSWFNYVVTPSVWVAAGTIAALLAWYGYAAVSGNSIGQFGVYFSQRMLWYRLLPNATYDLGVLPAVLFASLPILGIIAIKLYKSRVSYRPIRLLGVGSILSVLFITGLIVSAKIGGGNNIHNLDAYLLILLITGSYIYFDKTPPDYKRSERSTPRRLANVFLAAAVLIPVLFLLQTGKSLTFPDQDKSANTLLTIQEYADQAVRDGGKVLFIAERQLLVFKDIEGVPIVPDYERQILMEMAMAGEKNYLDEFSRRIENQEFALIVIEPLKVTYKGRDVAFGDENDAYVRWVSEPILCSYEPFKTISKMSIQLLAPREEGSSCQ
jgi:hypothetical protein